VRTENMYARYFREKSRGQSLICIKSFTTIHDNTKTDKARLKPLDWVGYMKSTISRATG